MGSQTDGNLSDDGDPIRRILGYLNFSSGQPDAQFLAALNQQFAQAATDEAAWQQVCEQLQAATGELVGSSAAFADMQQAEQILGLLGDFVPAYREFHGSLLEHLDDNRLFNSFLIGRAMEALLWCRQHSTDAEVIVSEAVTRLNDYIGYRPVATLETQKIEPYPHEWIRPIPIYVAGAGAAFGDYEGVVSRTIQMLRQTPDGLLRDAYFDPDRLDELAIDPRVYDFDHPANKRPNHHFGMWDPHHIDGDGFYRRFVVQQVTIDALLARVGAAPGLSHEELLTEAAAVLCGTILMSAGISGFGPETHDSNVSLSALLAKIATYRDAFYEQLIARMDGTHGARLQEEARRLKQPFAGARQDLNRQLTRCRATQLQRVHLARIYARMDFAEAAEEQTAAIQVPSARYRTRIDCKLARARAGIEEGTLDYALQSLEASRQEVLEGIACGALVDPWNILGFDCNYSLFGPIENSIRDYRIDDLVEIVEEMLELYARLWGTAAASQANDIAKQTSTCFEHFANWWYQFAAHELDSVEAEDPLVVYEAAKGVAQALRAWQEQGEASGDIGFWAPHVQNFDSCRAYWLVTNTLLARDDKVAALGLLMHWLSQSDRIPLEHGEASFFGLAMRWLAATLDETGSELEGIQQRFGWKRIRRFFDYLEANAGEFWQVPDFAPESISTRSEPESDAANAWEEDEEDEQDELFGAAYENVVYRDSTDDGVDGSIFDFETHDEDYLQQVSRPIVDRLTFLEQVASTWKLISVAWSSAHVLQQSDALAEDIAESMHDLLTNALSHLQRTAADLRELIESVSSYRISSSGGDPESMEYYDRLRLLKDSLIEQIVNANVCVIEGIQFLSATLDQQGAYEEDQTPDELRGVELLRTMLRRDPQEAVQAWSAFRESLQGQPILYVPLARGGNPKSIVRIKARQQLVQNLLHWLPRNGLLLESYQLLELVRRMERLVPVGSGAITEFDDLFEVCCRALVTALIDAAEATEADPGDASDALVAHLEEMMEPLLRSWLGHSRTLRLSVLEQVADDTAWQDLVDFVRRFGHDLFTQRFLNLGNVRGILHQGVEAWLEHLLEYGEDEDYQPLLDALEHDLEMPEAVTQLTLILEAIVESYSEYRDYNSTTTQSDRGELLYTLLDFLRLRVSYDRVAWNLRPVVLAHKVLAERGRDQEAERWRQSLRKRIQGEAKRHMNRLNELQQQYAMRLPSISKRISEQFMRPLLIDYQCAFVKPAMEDADESVRNAAFEGIRAQSDIFMNEPSGAGLDVPAWLIALEDTAQAIKNEQVTPIFQTVEKSMLPSIKLSVEEIQEKIQTWQQDQETDES